ncbi:nucleotidyltransferase family protein [Undibacterium cyanobacteriorum]|uniref:Nucleotidyltransferase family protein n=1 Tax=Undibacterium cyanobacteriorum TaxID=3073561 RepID=A0ABY9RDH9_9BURK|nr:nucleotidyltransferase family protein [Undibacterium sp. 20NA77.5]WMW79296.1 nucleotidyltransferase family protein [Undibacterium sp. 20NA77.5]
MKCLLTESECHAILLDLIYQHDTMMAVLDHAKKLDLSSWAIGAGAIRALVWDELHGMKVPSHVPDWDLIYYDTPSSSDDDAAIRAHMHDAFPQFEWDVVNQAHVHRWLAVHLGRAISPFPDLISAIASWPEIATCVGVSLEESGQVKIHAPYGLQDLFSLCVRRNVACLDREAFAIRRLTKQWERRWSQLVWLDDL